MDIVEDNKSVTSCTRFGRELKISPKSNTMMISPGYELKFGVDMIEVPIAVGNHQARVLMTREAWEEFNAGQEVSIDTVKDFIKGFIK